MTDTTRQNFINKAAERIDAVLKDTGRSFDRSSREIAEVVAERAAALVDAVGEPGYELAVRAEADTVLLAGGILTVNLADEADARLVSVVKGIIRDGVIALATA